MKVYITAYLILLPAIAIVHGFSRTSSFERRSSKANHYGFPEARVDKKTQPSTLKIKSPKPTVLEVREQPNAWARVSDVFNRKVSLQPFFNNNGTKHEKKALAESVSHEVALVVGSAMLFFFTTVLNPMSAFAVETATSQAAAPTQQSLLIQSPSTTEPQQEEVPVVEEAWNLVNKYYIDRTFNNQNWDDVKTKALEEAKKSNFDNDQSMKIVNNMIKSLDDRYTRVLDAQQYAAIQKFDLIGVGVTLMPNAQKDIIVGSPPIEGSASAKAGLKVGDFVTAVNGQPTRGRNAFDIIDQISEDPNAKTVTFSILRKTAKPSLDSLGDENSAQSFDVTMERQTMKVKDPVEYRISERRKDGTIVGYVRITEFNSLVNSSLQKALQELKREGANAYVLDLRFNTGGAFQSAVEIAGMFLRDRVATYVVDSNQVELPFRTPKMQDLAVEPDKPMVIFLDEMSASASEVLASSLHDNCRAVTMGNLSFGKGKIQAVYGLKNGAGLILTVAKYITPNGDEIQGKGIKPDVELSMVPIYVPVFGTADTSKIDFKDVSRRLDPKSCQVPPDRVTATAADSAITL